MSRKPTPNPTRAPRFPLLGGLLIAALLWPAAVAAAGTEVLVRGKVVDEAGEPIRDATITMTRSDKPDWREVLETRRNGKFKLFLRDGAHKFEVRVEKEGYQITESEFEPLVLASAEERQMGLGSTRGSSFELNFTLRSFHAEKAAISAQDAYNEGVAAARQRRYDDAVAAFKQVLEEEPGHGAARLALIKVYHDSRQAVPAAELLPEVLEAEDVTVPTLELSYHIFRDAGRLDEAAESLDRLWARAPQAAADELFELATIHRSKGDKEKARVAVERVL
ncbi:MAG: tetratricopeptide repeat protein, partial [Acidobacteriota bacterium]